MHAINDLFHSMEYGESSESDAKAKLWLEAKNGEIPHFIGGEFILSTDKKNFININPATEKKIINVAHAGLDEVEKAVTMAEQGLQEWQSYSPFEQASKLYGLARHIQKHARLFSVLESLDTGKPIRESKNIDIPLVVRHFYYHAGWIKLIKVKLPEAKPIGIVGQIIPWNFPLLMLSWKIAPAIAMGNAVILKPSENSPFTACLFAEICQQIGMPRGLINVLHGFGQTGELIATHPKIKKVAFTGSTKIGKHLKKITAGTHKKLSLELGGKSPFIVCDSADLDSAVEGLVDSIWLNQGEVCCAGSRLLVQESIASIFIDKLKKRMEKLIVGDSLDKNIDIGAIINQKQLERIQKMVEQGRKDGAEIWQPQIQLPKKGYYFPPTLCLAESNNILSCEEVFGPVLTAMPFRNYDEAIKLANHTRYGLSASIWSENINTALELAKRIQTGTVWVNCANLFDACSGFGGYKESGFGREGGMEGLWEYLQFNIVQKKSTEILLTKELKQQCPSKHGIDQTRKLYIGGKQVRPDSGYSQAIFDPQKTLVGEVPLGNRKDIRNAVEEARNNKKWQEMNQFARAQILYYFAENLEQRKNDFIEKMQIYSNYTTQAAEDEVQQSIEMLFFWAGLADKNEGLIHQPPMNTLVLALPEAFEALAIICPDQYPLYAFVYAMSAAIAMGNAVVMIPSENASLIVFDLVQIMETSDLPNGTVNIISGEQQELSLELAKHDGISKIWYFGSTAFQETLETNATNNLKQIWCADSGIFAATKKDVAISKLFVHHATQIKNIWIPFGF